jgi:hypothetical protein
MDTFQLPDREDRRRHIVGYAISPDASNILVAVCTRGSCSDLGCPSSDAQTSIYRSRDGGITWHIEATLDRDAWPHGFLETGQAVVSTHNRDPECRSFGVFLYPEGTPVAPPIAGDTFPLVLESRLFWISGTVAPVLHETGKPLFQSRLSSMFSGLYGLIGSPDGGWLASVHAERGPYVVPVDHNGRIGYGAYNFGQDGTVFRAPQATRLGIEVPDLRLIFGNAMFGVPDDPSWHIPGVLDLESASIHAVKGLKDEEWPRLYGRGYVVAVQHGQFARVVNTGSCLNVREAPSTSATVRECAADDVLLRIKVTPAGVTPEVIPPGWLPVVTPSGQEGWASMQFLEY